MIDHDPDHPDSTERWIDDTLASLRNKVVARDAEIARVRAGFMKCIQGENECDAWLHGSACRAAEKCQCALELELWINRAAPKEDT